MSATADVGGRRAKLDAPTSEVKTDLATFETDPINKPLDASKAEPGLSADGGLGVVQTSSKLLMTCDVDLLICKDILDRAIGRPAMMAFMILVGTYVTTGQLIPGVF